MAITSVAQLQAQRNTWGENMLYHHHGPYFTTLHRPRLLASLECRGWKRMSARGQLFRLIRQDASITIEQSGTVVANGSVAEAVLHELARIEVLQW